ncbi:lipid IV(A) 3-deoxy-D-manno-octulosonic acid transferase [Jeongeupia naejangsanensis]|uniref:3-deoxy-D-manno-octulosonic acid transferase n=1 Tax=Jeongeupia naejangsanensis TaxID=613195 RepID=A0ABS2BQ32_9NEIS|nr:lipid IV(A) 3-deoxy-D-manno-octulosonic acid transferase [Jeongeupia naejangsanensis]MBM3117520.1 lipid IV(A) 3-deoxy-D-manno-octulosonic acid transferase [Jeongeupia naejangsanensis]
MSRRLYALLLWLVTPLIRAYLRRRAKKQPAYLEHWDERWARYAGPAPQAYDYWLHAVSVGEMRAAASLIRALRQREPAARLLLSCMTPTGRETALELYGGDGIGADVVYLPYDRPAAVRRFLARFSPRCGLLLETELWPNLIHGCADAGVPLLLVNARLSAKSARGYARVRWLIEPALARLSAVLAQGADDAERLVLLGARNVKVCGNLKYDNRPDAAVVARGQGWRALFGGRPVLLVASSRDGEEALLLDGLDALPAQTLVVIVPRHPQRFDDVAALIEARGLTLLRRRDWAATPVPGDVRVLLGDSMGELAAWYACADLAVIGGSILPFGSQNLIEACALACPVLLGPSTYNFADAARDALAAGAAWQGQDAAALLREAAALLDDQPRRLAMGQAGAGFAERHRGATARVLTELERHRPLQP